MKLAADLHCHTISSGHAYSTVQEIAREASTKGLEMIAITDHGPSMPGAPHLYHFGNLRVLPEEIYGVKILKGVEANIIDYEGTLDLPKRYLKMLDIVLAGFHTYCYPGGTVEENTKAMINAMKNPFVDIVVHPGNPEFPINISKVVKAARDLNVFIEINNSSFTVSRRGSEENCLAIAKKCAELGAGISLGSDAHIAFDVGNFHKAMEVVIAAGIKEQQILNTSVDKIKKYLEEKGKGSVPKAKKASKI